MNASRCVVQWGACPDHGNSLVDDGGRSRCTVCGRRWAVDRLHAPCDEPGDVAILVDGVPASDRRMCRGHALAARGQTPEWVRFEPQSAVGSPGAGGGAS